MRATPIVAIIVSATIGGSVQAAERVAEMKASTLLLVTWFYYGQPPTTSQTTFNSMEACTAARDAVLQDAARLKADADREVARQRTQGTISNPVIPTASAVCAAQ
jgi:hypothetical protein